VIRVELLGGFRVVADGRENTIPASTRRLVAFLALRGRPAERAHVAGCLYTDKSEERAQANLRSALWRLRQCAHQLVEADPTRVWLRSGVEVDIDEAVCSARRLIDERVAIADPSFDKALFCGDLLPEWYDDFVELERERLRQLRLHALEAVGRRLLRLGRHAEALDAALVAVAHEPMRESAHRLTIEIHLAEGNPSEAVRQYGLLERILDDELGVAPSSDARRLVVELRPHAPAAV
jgi:DNA-binding SARP family transcriptional activator